MKRVEATVFADNVKEIDAKSLNDYQNRQIPELADDQIARVWMFSDERDLNSFKRLLAQWASASNLCSFVLSDETGIVTLGGKLFGGMMYKLDDSDAIESDQTYATPEHDSSYGTKDSAWAAQVTFEERISGDDKYVDLIVYLTETYESATKEWRLVASSVATLASDEAVTPGTNVVLDEVVSCTAYYSDVEVGTVSFIPIYDEFICDVPERYNIQSIESAYVDGEVLDGTYRSSGIFSIKSRKEGSRIANDKRFALVQALRRKYIASNDYSKTGTKWEIRNGREFRSGSSSPVLQLRNLDPSVARSIAKDISSSQTTYTNEIHTTTDGLLSGTWYSRYADFGIEDDGSGTVLWFLSLHNNEDFWTSLYADSVTAELQFFKIDATDSSKEDLLDNYYFTPDLDWYYREGDSGNATKKNGEDVDIALPSDADNLRTQVEGRIARIDPRYSEDRDDWFLQARITFYVESRLGVSVYRSSHKEFRAEIVCLLPTKQESIDLQAQSYFDDQCNWYTSSDGVEIDTKNGVSYSGSDTIFSVGATKLSVDVDGRQARVSEVHDSRAARWALSFAVVQAVPDVRFSGSLDGQSCVYASSPYATTTHERGYRVSATELRTVIEAYSDCEDGSMQNIKWTDVGNGRYDYEALSVSTAGFATSFVLGGISVYFGYHYGKIPTTDTSAGSGSWVLVGDNYENDTHILLGGYSDGGTILSSIDTSQNVSPSIKHEDDGTWSWGVRITSVADETYGATDLAEPSNWLFRYGHEDDEWRWVGRRFREELIVGGTIDVRGRFVDIPAGEFGNHEALSGRRIIMRELRNQNIDDGRVSYDVYERVITAEIEDDDGWYFAGVVEATDREKRILGSLATKEFDYRNFGSYPGNDDNFANAAENNGATYHAYENAVMRRKSVQVHRKYFVRRPKRTDLESSNNDDENSIWDAMVALADIDSDPDPLSVVTFSVRQVSSFKFIVERRTLSVSATWHMDDDAFSRYTINGSPACKLTRIESADIMNVDAT